VWDHVDSSCLATATHVDDATNDVHDQQTDRSTTVHIRTRGNRAMVQHSHFAGSTCLNSRALSTEALGVINTDAPVSRSGGFVIIKSTRAGVP
jgi:hypothetical protein